MKYLKDIDVAGKRVLVRCDFNVPLDQEGNITDDFRIKQVIPTIKHLVQKGAKVVLMSHLDPKSTGVVDKRFTMDPIAQRLSDLMEMTIEKEDDCIGPEVENTVMALEPGKVLMLENLRFHKEETANDEKFGKQLSYLGEIYVNEAFGVNHRAHASVARTPDFLPAYTGLLLQKEMESLDKIIASPVHPMVAIVGGTKVETKAAFINKISQAADTVLLGGLLMAETKEKSIALNHAEKIIGPTGDLKALDINEETIQLFVGKIRDAKTVLWNGAVGKFEDAQHEKGTLAIANAVIASGAFSVAGGGETVEFLEKHGMLDKFSHVSTGGGAMISYLAGEPMPGIDALQRNAR